jgi:hypothetical protein
MDFNMKFKELLSENLEYRKSRAKPDNIKAKRIPYINRTELKYNPETKSNVIVELTDTFKKGDYVMTYKDYEFDPLKYRGTDMNEKEWKEQIAIITGIRHFRDYINGIRITVKYPSGPKDKFGNKRDDTFAYYELVRVDKNGKLKKPKLIPLAGEVEKHIGKPKKHMA